MKNKQKKQLIDIIQPYVTFAVIAFFIFTCCRGIYNIYNRNKKIDAAIEQIKAREAQRTQRMYKNETF